ncbi:hypothetical protein AXX17_AT1G33770 [Arabidopsis thaliana]|uniref:Uncharacterized protein n=1 Tax=Arabidopsis thaliana TaxID=3702 RepID=A0A178WBM2_ARATH|nr:hypothetical protein AXX17_AT1G33770 [Arabidopsis thaliana]
MRDTISFRTSKISSYVILKSRTKRQKKKKTVYSVQFVSFRSSHSNHINFENDLLPFGVRE